MCGIAGLWLRNRASADPARTLLAAMLGEIEHRGPDDSGMWADADGDVTLGHRRLAVIDPSPSGHQPMVSANGRLVVVFNGEIYNYRELRDELAALGHRFVSSSDTEVLLAGYQQWGAKVIDRLVGMFAFAIWDTRARTLTLARDRTGEKPLYYAAAPWGFAFASELGALTQCPSVDLGIDQDAVALYLHYQYVPSPRSIYRGVRKLPPGHVMVVSDDALVCSVDRYWDPVSIAANPTRHVAEGDALEELESLLRRVLTGQLIADVPLGAFLSGGIDSSAVVSLMTEMSSRRVQTFTIGFDDPRFDESAHAAAVAKHLGTEHTTEYFTEHDALDVVPRIPTMFGEPFADMSALPTHLLSVIARKQVTVSISGDGGDEAFGGYDRYDWLERVHRMSRAVRAFGPLATVGARVPGRAGRVVRLLTIPDREAYRALVSIFRDERLHELMPSEPPLPEFDRAWDTLASKPVRRRAMVADLLTYLPEAVLTKVDRASMATSLETRAPLLDHRVLEFSLRLPPRLVHQKRLLKQLAYRRIPRKLLDRPKQGFGVPIGRWFRGALRQPLLDVVTPESMRAVGIENFTPVRRLMDDHLTGRAEHPVHLWSLLVLGLWHDARRSRGAGDIPALAADTSHDLRTASVAR